MPVVRMALRLAALALPLAAGAAAQAGTLEDVQSRGQLHCGVSAGLAGFAAADANDIWTGFEVDFCRAVAAAVLGDPTLVKYVAVPGSDGLSALEIGAVDLIARKTAWSVAADASLAADMVAISFYDQLGFLLPVELGVGSGKELDGSTICVSGEMTTAVSLDDFFRANAISYQTILAPSDADLRQTYLSQGCEAYARASSELAAIRASFEAPAAHVIVKDPASRLPSGPVVREGDDPWADVVRWTLFALLSAEELGVTSANVREMATAPVANPEVNRLLGNAADVGGMLGLSPDWAVDAIAAGGNYGEIFERHIGENTPIGLARGLNALWTQGGLQYAPPFR